MEYVCVRERVSMNRHNISAYALGQNTHIRESKSSRKLNVESAEEMLVFVVNNSPHVQIVNCSASTSQFIFGVYEI